MIQNYVRVGLIPMPADKRYYQKKHLVILLLVYDLKNIFSLDELKSMFEIFYSDDDFDYLYFVDCFNESFNDAVNNEMNVLKPLENTKSSKLEALLKLSARASALKYIVQEKL